MSPPHPHAPPGPQAASFPVAELERRFYGFALDRFLVWGLAVVAGLATWLAVGQALVVVLVAGGVVLVGWLALAVLAGVGGATPGKYAVGLRVVRQDSGAPLGLGRALLRSLVLAVAGLPTFGLGLATLAWTAVEDRLGQRRGWHDLRVGSVVVDVRPVVEVAEDEEDAAPRHIVNLTALRLVPAPAVPPREVPSRTAEQSVPRSVQPAPAGPSRASQPAAYTPAPPSRQQAPQPSSADDPGRTVVRPRRSAAPAAPRWRVTLDSGETFVVEGLVLLGRRPEPRHGEQVHHLVPLRSADMSVSKTHAQVQPAADGVLVVTDRGSTNGSVLVRQGVARPLAAGRPATLLAGDTLQLGDRELTVSRES